MHILLASSEVFPYAKTGGLADMVGALGKYVAQHGHDVSIVTPLYADTRENFSEIEPTSISFSLPLGNAKIPAAVHRLAASDRLTVYFVEQADFYDRKAPYGEEGTDYSDNAERFVFFSKSVVALASILSPAPQIIHAHDWQTGLVGLLIRHQGERGGLTINPRTVFTVHNLAYQGNFPAEKYALTNLPWDYFTPEGVEFYGQMSCLKAGLVFSDVLTTVSPRYAREITTEAQGYGLDGVVRSRQKELIGILNGVDYQEWNTTANPRLTHSYAVDNFEGKVESKRTLQREMGLPQTPELPLFGIVSRLVDQKGIDILIGALEEMLTAPMQFVLLGSGRPDFEKALRGIAARYPTKAAVRIGYSHSLAHRIEAGCDFFLMPSLYEPCGLNQMYSLRYGTIPIVRVTGGLDDSVVDIVQDIERADGIKFYQYSSSALAKAIRKAMVLFDNKELLSQYRHNAMRTDFSWERTALKYIQLYESTLNPAKAVITLPS